MRRRQKPEDLTPEQAQASALRILARREHSAAQLRHKLALRGHGQDTADAVIGDLAAAGWQSDARYAEVLARARADQGYGPLRIRAELQEARVTEAEIQAALQALECDFSERAGQLRARRYGEDLPQRGPDWHKQYRFLAGRGFTPEQIRAALKGDPDDY